MKRVVFSVSVLKHYRVDFHRKVRSKLASCGIDYSVVYSLPVGEAARKKDTVELNDDTFSSIPSIKIKLFGKNVFFQNLPIFREVDMLILTQSNSYICNYLVQLFRRLLPFKIVQAGHGKNYQSTGDKWYDHVKRYFLTKSDGWLTYTEGTKKYLQLNGVPDDRVFSFNNTINEGELIENLEKASKYRHEFRTRFSIPENAKVCVFIGGIYKEKLPEFMVDIINKVTSHSEIYFLIAGSGTHADIMVNCAKKNKYVHYLDVATGFKKAQILDVADLIFMPGLIGLITIDSFYSGVPIITMEQTFHSPEFHYLNEKNSVILNKSTSSEKFASELISLLHDKERMDVLRQGAYGSRVHYSQDNMVEKFCEGVKILL